MTVLRSPLFIPGNRSDMLDKATRLTPDAFLPDLEDTVPAAEKEAAREITAAALPGLSAAGPLVIPRVNSLDTGLLEDDLAAMVCPSIFGIIVGKIGTAEEVQEISGVLSALERKVALEEGKVKIVPLIETAKAVVNAYRICTASPRIVAVAFGAEDFTADMGIPRTLDDSEVAYAKQVITVAARAADILVVDTPFFAFRDHDGLQRDVQAARRIGFTGKLAIHPSQIDIINQAFSPSEEEVAHARRVVAAYDEAQRTGSGATSLDDRLIDEPVVKRARSILEMVDESDRLLGQT